MLHVFFFLACPLSQGQWPRRGGWTLAPRLFGGLNWRATGDGPVAKRAPPPTTTGTRPLDTAKIQNTLSLSFRHRRPAPPRLTMTTPTTQADRREGMAQVFFTGWERVTDGEGNGRAAGA